MIDLPLLALLFFMAYAEQIYAACLYGVATAAFGMGMVVVWFVGAIVSR